MVKKKKTLQEANHVWKIRKKSDGLFSKGSGSRPGFSREGKCFYSEQKLLAHLNMVSQYRTRYRQYGGRPAVHPYLGCEIVQYRITEEVGVPFEGYGE